VDTVHIRDAVRERPFKPFTLRMNDGWQFHVPHPEYVAVSSRLVVAIDPHTEAVCWLEPMLIASLDYNTQAPKATP
jgi:hypothetical protein